MGSMAYPPHARQSLPRAWKRSCLRPASVSPLPSFCPSQKRFSTSRENALGSLQKTNMHGCAGTERGAPANTRALDNPKTAADRKHERSQACRRQLHGGTLVFRGRLLEFSPSALLRGNAAVIQDGEARTLHAVFAVDDCGVYVRARSLSCLCKYCVCVISLSLFPLFPL
jgi:hypothetical protein